MLILVVNTGSSSLKYQLINMDDGKVAAKGLCERIGIGGHMKHSTGDGRVYEEDRVMDDHESAMAAVIDMLTSKEYGVIADLSEIDAIGHRVVQGAEVFPESVVLDEEKIQQIYDLGEIAPLHNYAAAQGMWACRKCFGDKPMVAVFDTSFHQTMPDYAYMLGLPYEYYEKYAIRRYGAHGTSHKYVAGRCAALMGKDISELKIITCHLGNGSSITAVDGGKSVDTSMSFTPLGGVIMGTRTGDIDPMAIFRVMEKENKTPADMVKLCNKESGFVGLSGVSSDSRDLHAAAESGNDRARLVLDEFRYQVKKYIGSYAAAMGGVDAVVFTAGIGENDAEGREKICEGLEFLGIKVDAEKNKVRGEEVDISAPGATVRTFIIPTNEELAMARETAALVFGK